MEEQQEKTPTIQDLAKSAAASYSMTINGNKSSRLEHAQSVAPDNYTLLPQYTDRMISTFKQNNEPTYIIAHRGTDFSGTQAKKDLVSDWNIIIGNQDSDTVHNRRTKKTERIIKGLISNNSDPIDIFLTGFSLGGSTANHALVSSQFVRDNVKELHTFNAGSSPIAVNEIDKNSKLYNDIKAKSIHHHIKGDLVSDNVKNTYIGKHKTYISKKKPTISQKVMKLLKPLLGPLGTLWNLKENVEDKLSKHSLENFTGM